MRSESWLALLWLCLAACLSACLADGPVKIAYNDEPRPRDDGWVIGAPESQGFDPEGLRRVYRRFFSEDEYVTARSLLVIRNGVLVAEGYCRDLDDIHKKQALMSATKSVNSILTGMMIDRGLITLDSTLGELLPQAVKVSEAKRGITVANLLTMRSGLLYSNDDFSLDMAHGSGGNRIRHILDKPLVAAPGSRFEYQDCDPHLLSACLSSAADRNLSRFADEALFAPLGIHDRVWLTDQDGLTYGAYGLYLRPRDFAKIGQMVLQGGVWEGTRIVSSSWLETSTAAHVDPDLHGLGFGYQWWTTERVGGFFAWGHGGQYLLVIPAQQLVVVFTAEPDTSSDKVAISPPGFLELVDGILSSIEDPTR